MYVQTVIEQRVYETPEGEISYSQARPLKSIVSDSLEDVIDNLATLRQNLNAEYLDCSSSVRTKVGHDFDAASPEWKFDQKGTVNIIVEMIDKSSKNSTKLKQIVHTVFVQRAVIGHGFYK